MTMIDPLQQLVTKALNKWQKRYLNNHWVHTNLFAKISHVLFEVILQILKDKNQFTIGMNDLPQMNNVDMTELLENGNLTNGR
jgi:hypothetical protein